MTVKPSTYRAVFGTPEGRAVLADLARIAEAFPTEHAGSAGRMIAHIVKMREMDDPEPEQKKPQPQRPERIAHGS